MPTKTKRKDANEEHMDGRGLPAGPLAAVGGLLVTGLVAALVAARVVAGRREQQRSTGLGTIGLPGSLAAAGSVVLAVLAAVAAFAGVADPDRRARLATAAGEAASAVTGAARAITDRAEDLEPGSDLPLFDGERVAV
jgi:hypothetical protein